MIGRTIAHYRPNQLSLVAAVHYVARRYEEAIVAASRAIAIDPTYSFAYDRLGRAYTGKGMHEQAIVTLETAVRLSGGPISHGAPLARAYALAGRRSEAVRNLEELLKLGRRNYVGPFHIAMIYTALGEKDEALRWLEEAYRVRDGNMVLLKVLPEWDPLRADPRFRDLLQRMKFP